MSAREACSAALRCPVCEAAFQPLPGTLRCAKGHTFDVAREGYVNLLPAGHGRSGRTGDPAEMIRARARFLERGYYEPLADAVASHAAAAAEPASTTLQRPLTVLDAGCGTGYFLAHTAPALADTGACLLGFDLSRDAVRLAARGLRNAVFFVNDVTQRLSVADGAVDLLLNIFAPRNASEFARVLRPGGGLIVVIPGEDHLHELRARLPLLDVGPDKEARVATMLAGSFERSAREVVRFRRTLGHEAVADLLRMTPSAWHLQESAWKEVAALEEVGVTLGFIVLRFRRTTAGVAGPAG